MRWLIMVRYTITTYSERYLTMSLGILPHDGRNITFRQLNDAVRKTYNFAPSFCYFVPNTIATILERNYWTDSFDLSDIDVHNGIEHDASLTRRFPDVYRMLDTDMLCRRGQHF